MSTDLPIPETRVLAIASHVVYGYVGNTMAAFVLQSLGCEVAALNTVHFSNSVPYGRLEGTTATAKDILEIYDGLKQSYLTDFDVLLSGFTPGAEAVEAVGAIGRDLKLKSLTKPGSFFWVLDPVMGDQGELYVDENVVPAYKKLMRDADLLIPNQFELEKLTDHPITTPAALSTAISKLHTSHQIPHILVTSVTFSPSSPTLSIIGSTHRPTDRSARLFSITIPSLNCFFSGTGDMFAALLIARMREATVAAGLDKTASWVSPDHVQAVELPLAKAAEKVLASMHMVLKKTKEARDKELEGMKREDESEERRKARETKAAEVRLVRNLRDLKEPEDLFHAEPLML